MSINPIHINTAGLIFDIIGAFLVSCEVVNQYHGKKTGQSPQIYDADDPPFETKEYKKWESSKYKKMLYGLICLIIGFLLQISSNYLKSENPIIPMSIHSEAKPTINPPQNSMPEPEASPITKAIPPTNIRAINIK